MEDSLHNLQYANFLILHVLTEVDASNTFSLCWSILYCELCSIPPYTIIRVVFVTDDFILLNICPTPL